MEAPLHRCPFIPAPSECLYVNRYHSYLKEHEMTVPVHKSHVYLFYWYIQSFCTLKSQISKFGIESIIILIIKLLDIVMYATLQSLHLWLVAFVFGFVFLFLCDDPRLNLLTWGIFILKMVRTFSCCLGWLVCFLENKTATGFLLLSLSVGASGVACKYLTRHCTQTTSFHILCIIRVVFNVPPVPYK